MRLKLLLVPVVFTVGLALWYFLAGTQPVVNYPPKNDIIVAFGDSLVAGVGATVGNDFVSVLSRTLGKPIVNLGRSGDTTADGLLRVGEVLEENPGIVILLLGGNDYLRRLSVEETQYNLETLITQLQSQGTVIVLLGVRGGVLIDGREKLYANLSDAYGTLYVSDVLDGVFGNPDLMYDGIHPNDRGYAVIAGRVAEVFKKEKLLK